MPLVEDVDVLEVGVGRLLEVRLVHPAIEGVTLGTVVVHLVVSVMRVVGGLVAGVWLVRADDHEQRYRHAVLAALGEHQPLRVAGVVDGVLKQ